MRAVVANTIRLKGAVFCACPPPGQIVPSVPCAQSGEYEDELWNLFIHIKKVIVLYALLAMDGSCSATFPLMCL